MGKACATEPTVWKIRHVSHQGGQLRTRMLKQPSTSTEQAHDSKTLITHASPMRGTLLWPSKRLLPGPSCQKAAQPEQHATRWGAATASASNRHERLCYMWGKTKIATSYTRQAISVKPSLEAPNMAPTMQEMIGVASGGTHNHASHAPTLTHAHIHNVPPEYTMPASR